MVKFELHNPVKLIFGEGEVSRIGSEARQYGGTALLVSYAEHAFMKPLLDRITANMEAEGITVVPFFEVVANPRMGTVRKGAALCREKRVDMLVAVGGGSVIDSVKFIAAGVNYEGDIWNMVVSRHDAPCAVPPTSALPTLIISTIPATGSEMNCGAVVTNEETLEKSYMFTPCVYPKVAILDPELTCSLPPYQTGCGIADAISHVLEVYFNGADGAPLQQRIMEGIVGTLMQYAPRVMADPNDIEARAQIQWAACVAWNGWTLPGTVFSSPMHMIAHPLSARYNLTHGATLATIMPAFMKYTCKRWPQVYVLFAEKMLGMDVKGRDAAEVAEEAIERFECFLKSLGVETRLSECNVPSSAIEELLQDTVKIYFAADGTLGAREPLSRDDVREILKLAY